MTLREMMHHVDHTLLKPYASLEDIRKLCKEALEYETASVCIPPTYVGRVHREYGSGLNICTVIGFPLGYSVTEAKIAEAESALREGCNEIDMVINITDVKNGMFGSVEQEIRQLKEICGTHILKVIVETCYLTREEKIALCHAVTEAGADYIKTSTGFGEAGAMREDVELFLRHIGPGVKIKAAGGISTPEDVRMFLELGCERISTSRAVGLYRQAMAEGTPGNED